MLLVWMSWHVKLFSYWQSTIFSQTKCLTCSKISSKVIFLGHACLQSNTVSITVFAFWSDKKYFGQTQPIWLDDRQFGLFVYKVNTYKNTFILKQSALFAIYTHTFFYWCAILRSVMSMYWVHSSNQVFSHDIITNMYLETVKHHTKCVSIYIARLKSVSSDVIFKSTRTCPLIIHHLDIMLF